MHAAAMRVDLRLFDVRSRKDKRSIIKRLISQLGRTHQVSVAEIDHQDLYQRSAIGVAVVSAHPGHSERILLAVERDLRSNPQVEVLGTSMSHLEEPS